MAKDSSASMRQQAPHLPQIHYRDQPTSAALVQEKIPALARERIEALSEIICGAGDEAAGALLVLMGTLVDSADPKSLANAAMHFAFTRCGELNLYGMVEAQIALVEGELLASG